MPTFTDSVPPISPKNKNKKKTLRLQQLHLSLSLSLSIHNSFLLCNFFGGYVWDLNHVGHNRFDSQTRSICIRAHNSIFSTLRFLFVLCSTSIFFFFFFFFFTFQQVFLFFLYTFSTSFFLSNLLVY